MAAIGLIVHQSRRAPAAAAGELSAWLAGEGHQVRVAQDQQDTAARAAPRVAAEDFADGLDVVVTLGGDGSILRAVELIGAADVPILGVNFGRMGYLTEVAPADVRSAIARVIAGDCSVEERMLLAVEFQAPDADAAGCRARRAFALNEALVERPAASYALRLGVSFNGEKFTNYVADGLIVSTPTGSTAYSMSAGGPVVDPAHRALLVTPVSPHMLFNRSMVLPADTVLQLEVLSHQGAVLSVDGRRLAELEQHDVVKCSASGHRARLVTFGAKRFHQVLKTKFGLNDR
ncbi:MAG: NAD(+)/NADH kinase [Acidimicrobiaceae bacterium]|nr:NAD(+)/NADH kinase [Acidimicrobiaceae bacterium]MCY4175315.1 NAD(+)/NADH kinase [Acidimicrobiaceae bacterium]MCY4280157.1 NAD(+)/NADH kinase [Acidimicrobiaceae bacterium]